LNNPSVGWEVNSVSKPEPRFYGNYVEIKLNGISRLYLHDLDEEYHLTRPTVFQSGLLGIGTKVPSYHRVSIVQGDEFLHCFDFGLPSTLAGVN